MSLFGSSPDPSPNQINLSSPFVVLPSEFVRSIPQLYDNHSSVDVFLQELQPHLFYEHEIVLPSVSSLLEEMEIATRAELEKVLQHSCPNSQDQFIEKKSLKRKRWTNEAMLLAVQLATTGLSTRAAANLCGVPKSTLWDRLSGRMTHVANRRTMRKLESSKCCLNES